MLGRLTRICCQPRYRFNSRSFSSLTTAFDLSRNPSKWPQPLKSRSCDSISTEDIASRVTLSGWVDSVRIMKDSVFIVLRDDKGKVQTMFSCDKEVEELLKSVPLESSVCITGTVFARPEDAVNPKMNTGKVEIHGEKLYLLNQATDLPFPYHGKLPKDEVLSKYRHLALRHAEFMNEIQFRSKFLHAIRDSMLEQSFIEVETPLLTRSSPEGAHELFVPTHLIPGGGFALSQSPQQYKQILMASGVEKYYQVARCFRNESGRKDRQLEFTQLDLEMAYVTDIHQIQSTVEQLIHHTFSSLHLPNPIAFQTITYHDALTRYGSDKPDLRIPVTLHHLPTTVGVEEMKIDKVISLRLPGLAKTVSNSKLKQLLKEIRESTSQGYQVLRCEVSTNHSLTYSPSCTNLLHMGTVQQHLHDQLQPGDLLLLGISSSSNTPSDRYGLEGLMGKLRCSLWEMGQKAGRLEGFKKMKQEKTPFEFLWVEHFPLLEWDKNGRVKAMHHPFTSPMEIYDVDGMKKVDPTSLLSNSCDLVLNGNEVGGGSLRIHNYDLQKYIMNEILGIQDTSVFDHLLNALKHGCPPHGGFAIGIDRFLAIMRDRSSIREEIAFPKSITGADLLTSAPTPISEEQWKEVGMHL